MQVDPMRSCCFRKTCHRLKDLTLNAARENAASLSEKLLKSNYQKFSAHSCFDEDGTSTNMRPSFNIVMICFYMFDSSSCIISSWPKSHLFPLLSGPTWPRSPRSGSACTGTLVQQHPTAQPVSMWKSWRAPQYQRNEKRAGLFRTFQSLPTLQTLRTNHTRFAREQHEATTGCQMMPESIHMTLG